MLMIVEIHGLSFPPLRISLRQSGIPFLPHERNLSKSYENLSLLVFESGYRDCGLGLLTWTGVFFFFFFPFPRCLVIPTSNCYY